MFQLNENEVDILVSQSVIPHKKYFGGRNPYAFTRNGANMLSAVIRSPLAIKRSIQIMRAFSAIEEAMSKNIGGLAYSPKIIEQISTHSKAIMHLFHDNNLRRIETSKLHEIQGKMMSLLQQIIIDSIKKER